jgi:hypothetical protein
MLMALSSTSSIKSPLGRSASEADPSAGVPVKRLVGVCASGVAKEEASMKVIGVTSELGVRGSIFRGRSKYESPSIVVGTGQRERV